MQGQDITKQISQTVAFLAPLLKHKPEVGLVLGSGLGAFVQEMQDPVVIPYRDIPHFEPTTIEGHEGALVNGLVGGVPVIALQGRWHYYEGYSQHSIVIPTRALATLGAHTLLLTNAAGGVNLKFKGGELMIIEDHINLMWDNPLTGTEPALFGPRFPDMSEVYCKKSRQLIQKIGDELAIPLQRGVYAALRGPTYETPAEVRMLRVLGVDAIGMSTVPEAIAARHLGMRVVGLSCITNLAAGMEAKQLSHREVQDEAHKIIKQFSALLNRAIPEIAKIQ
jgi:purine-nucleoside phosphorylase